MFFRPVSELSTGYPQVNEAVYEAVDNLWITIQMRIILIKLPCMYPHDNALQ